MKFFAVICLVSLGLILPSTHLMASALTNDNHIIGGLGVKSQGKTYASGSHIVTLPESDILGALIIAGDILSINGPIAEGLVVLGSETAITGPTQGDLRAISGKLVINSLIGGDLLAVSGNLALGPKTEILGETNVVTGQTAISGLYVGNMSIKANKVLFEATASQDVTIKAKDITIGAGAVITGNLTYDQNAKLAISDDAVIVGELIANDLGWNQKNQVWWWLGIVGLFQSVRFLGTLLAIILLSLIFVRATKKITQTAFQQPLPNLGKGLALVFLTPLVGLILLITIIGIPLAILLGAFYIFILILGGMYSGIVAGTWLRSKFTKNNQPHLGWSILGLLVLFFLMLIPIIGWLLVGIVHWLTIGTIVTITSDHFWKHHK